MARGVGCLFVLLLAWTFSAVAQERECRPMPPPDPPENPGYIQTTYYCDAEGALTRRLETFPSTRTKATEILYDLHQRRLHYRAWNIDQQQTVELSYVYPEDGTALEMSHAIAPGSAVQGKRQFRRLAKGLELLREWFYSEEKPDQPRRLTHNDAYVYTPKGERRIAARETHGPDERVQFHYDFEYSDQDPEGRYPIAFKSYDENGKLVKSYSQRRTLNEALDVAAIYAELGESAEQIAERLKRSQKPRLTVAVIDTGFDVFQRLLADQMWRNPDEPIDQRDNDGDGWIDNVMGWDWETQNPIPWQRIELDDRGHPPLSHGTHVATTVIKDLDYAAIVGFAGDFTNTQYMRGIERFLTRHQVRFANMSFGYPMADEMGGSMAPPTASYQALESVIEKNPQTLFVVAAGNDGSDLDGGRPCFPASYSYDNILVAAALATDRLNEDQLANYKMAKFSNYGTFSVDILTPGEEVEAASLGGGTIRHSGTSMASPYLLNLGVLPLAHENPGLSIAQIKEILLKTAYIPSLENPFPVRSGGIVFPSRALAVARLLKTEPHLNIESAALQVRIQNPNLVKLGERNDEAYLETLKNFWRRQQL